MILDVEKLLAPITVHDAIVRRHAETKACATMARQTLEEYEERRQGLKSRMMEVREGIQAFQRDGCILTPPSMIFGYMLLVAARKKNLRDMLRKKHYFLRQRRYLHTY